jgi:hypothetical protein
LWIAYEKLAPLFEQRVAQIEAFAVVHFSLLLCHPAACMDSLCSSDSPACLLHWQSLVWHNFVSLSLSSLVSPDRLPLKFTFLMQCRDIVPIFVSCVAATGTTVLLSLPQF